MTINMSRGRKDDIFKGSGTLISYWPCLKPLRNHLSVSQTMKCSLYFLNQYLAESGHWGFSFYDKRCSSATSNIVRLIGWLVRMSSCRLAVVGGGGGALVRCALIVFTWVQMILELHEKWNVDLSSTRHWGVFSTIEDITNIARQCHAASSGDDVELSRGNLKWSTDNPRSTAPPDNNLVPSLFW